MTGDYLRKSIDLDIIVKDVDTEKGMVSGYFSAFGNVDSQDDVIQRGAYAKSIAENGPKSPKPRIAHLYQHDAIYPVGVLQELMEDQTGLYFVSKLSKTQIGQDTLMRYQEGIIKEHSVGFRTMKYSYMHDDADKPSWDRIRTITEAKLFEGSSVILGANENTPFLGFKNQNPEYLATYIENINRVLHKGQKLSDEAFKTLEKELEILTKSLAELKGAGSTTPKDVEPNVIIEALTNYQPKIN